MNKRDFIKTGIFGLGMIGIPESMIPLEYFPMPSDKRIAVIFSSWCGTSRDAALWISEGMNGIANVFDVRENPDPSLFDHLIIGGSIRNSLISSLLKKYLEDNRRVLKNRVRGLFAVCGNMRNPVGEAQYSQFVDNQLAAFSGSGQAPSKVFLGRVTFGLMDPATKEIMMQIPGMEEYDNLNRADCMTFGKEILSDIT